MTSRKRRIRKTAKPRVGKYVAIVGLIIAAAMVVALVISGINLMKSWLEELPDYNDADAYLMAEPTTVLDAQGNVIAEFYAENREPITIDQCSQYVLDATIAVEDERYYSHNGIDIKGILRAVVVQLTGGSEGASTITQQLVRNTVLQDERFEQTLSRKVREAYIAMELEKIYTKDEILMMYLNSIYYGAGCYGIEAAAQTYFGKTCAELTLAEAATLAGLPQSPSSYDPTWNPDAAVERRNAVLYRMYVTGYIDEATYDETIAQQLVLNYTKREESGAYAYPYFVDYVTSKLYEQFSTDIIFKGGLTIYTTIEPSIQWCADHAVESVIGLATDDLEAALVCVNPHNGHILAMVGGWDYNTDQFNIATQARRQPGSSFKMFTLAAAIEAGMSPLALFEANSPIYVGDWQVANINWESYGIISLRKATLWSSNVVYAQVIDAIGAERVVDIARRMGISTELQPYNSIALGSEGVSVLEIASAYGTLATGGIYCEPTAITKVLDRNGNVLYEHEPITTQAIAPEVAYAVTDVLQGVLSYAEDGTGVEANLWVNQPVAGKTGTTENVRDLWFCGYTPQIATAVWTGYRAERTIYYLGMPGSTHILPNVIFSRFMSDTLTGVPRSEFPWANTPAYRDNLSWKWCVGTWTPPAPEEPEEDDEEGTTTTTPSIEPTPAP